MLNYFSHYENNSINSISSIIYFLNIFQKIDIDNKIRKNRQEIFYKIYSPTSLTHVFEKIPF